MNCPVNNFTVAVSHSTFKTKIKVMKDLTEDEKIFLKKLKYDPIGPLLRCENTAVRMFAMRDLLGKATLITDLLKLPMVSRILASQRRDGSWEYPGANLNIRSRRNFNQLETYRNLGILVEEFDLDRGHPAIREAAKFMFSFQTKTGDFRGIYGNQYTPNYSAGIAELLIKAGYGADRRIKKVLRWLLSIRQHDGGWAIPFRTKEYTTRVIYTRTRTIEPDLASPFSAMVTGVVLRAFSVHPEYTNNKAIVKAGRLLLSSLFTKDNYSDRAGKESWLGFNFPFWYTDLISALDSLSHLGFSAREPQIQKGLNWFVDHQQRNGLWKLKLLKGRNKDTLQLYLTLAICRIFKRFAMKLE